MDADRIGCDGRELEGGGSVSVCEREGGLEYLRSGSVVFSERGFDRGSDILRGGVGGAVGRSAGRCRCQECAADQAFGVKTQVQQAEVFFGL